MPARPPKSSANKPTPLYSTATGDQRSKTAQRPSAYTPGSGACKMRLETKGRGGKSVTVLFNLPFATAQLATETMKEMQANFGCGATFKDSTIELRGDVRERVTAFFASKGWPLVRAGG